MHHQNVVDIANCTCNVSALVPESVLIEINRLLFRFLWRKKKDCNRKAFEKVKRNVVCNQIDNSGLNMIDLREM